MDLIRIDFRPATVMIGPSLDQIALDGSTDGVDGIYDTIGFGLFKYGIDMTMGTSEIIVMPSVLADMQLNLAHTQTFGAYGGKSPYTYSVTSGALPTGLTLSSAGLLSGTPTALGTFSFTVTATDSLGNTGSRLYSVDVSNAATGASYLAA